MSGTAYEEAVLTGLHWAMLGLYGGHGQDGSYFWPWGPLPSSAGLNEQWPLFWDVKCGYSDFPVL